MAQPIRQPAQSTLKVSGFGCSHTRGRAPYDGDFWCRMIHPELVKILAEGPVLDHLSLECQVPLCFVKLCEQPHPSNWSPIRSLAIRIFEGWNEVIEGEVPSTSFDIPATVTSLEINLDFISDFGCPGRPLCNSPSAYAQLKSFSFYPSVSWNNAAALLQVLQYCTSLENLTIKFSRNTWRYDGQGYDVSGWPVSLPYLLTLRLEHACESDILGYLIMPALPELVVRLGGRQYRILEDFWWDLPDPELRYPNLRILRLYAPLSMNPLKLATALKCLPHLTELTLSEAVSDSHAEDVKGYYGGVNCGCTREENEEVEEDGEIPMCDVFQILHNWDQKDKARSLPYLQVLEVLNLPGNYNFSYICNYIAAPLTKSSGRPSNTLTRLTVTFLPTQLPNCNVSDFKNVPEELGSEGIKASISPSKLESARCEVYPFRV
ncbi:hypothetical protein EST38_g4503 [Candolleomyces aberdarensis]|uniref:Uncharacterized protein n=1 Tax=Candolleomyces aberdarensis TaxID=2316362 RepID=A0A4Q2DPP3_9AGAR|nr:hypothetical protein EST38_g4503 [Candolleomyces aberdarensis]